MAVVAGMGFTACNTGTDPGETNTERSGIERPEESSASRQYADTTNLEHHYEGRDSTSFNDGAYDQDGKREKRGQ